MNLQNGWGNVQAVENGIRWLRKLRVTGATRRGAFAHSQGGSTVLSKATPITSD